MLYVCKLKLDSRGMKNAGGMVALPPAFLRHYPPAAVPLFETKLSTEQFPINE
jgi:hypothetical protein